MKTTRKTATLVLSVLMLIGLLVPALAQSEDSGEPSEKMRIAQGRTSFSLYCRSCHGATAKGDGTVADILKIPPADLTTISARNGDEFPMEEVVRVIDGRKAINSHGRDMPFWGNAFKETEETDDEAIVHEKIVALAYYLKSIQVEASK